MAECNKGFGGRAVILLRLREFKVKVSSLLRCSTYPNLDKLHATQLTGNQWPGLTIPALMMTPNKPYKGVNTRRLFHPHHSHPHTHTCCCHFLLTSLSPISASHPLNHCRLSGDAPSVGPVQRSRSLATVATR